MATGESGGGSDGSGDRGRRYRQDLQGVMRFCADVGMEADDAANEGGEQQFEALTEERRQFLTQALGAMTVNIVDEQKKALQILHDNEADNESKVAALEALCELCEHIDAACDLQKLGGFSLLEELLGQTDPDIRWNAAECLAQCVQNNPYCQKAATNVRMMKALMNLVENDPVDLVRIKALYALSCLCRDCLDAQDEFCRLDGFSCLMRAMQRPSEKLQIKSAFMLSALCNSQPKFKDTLCDMGMVEQLIALLKTEHSILHEHLMSGLVTIVDGHQRSMQACQQPELELNQWLITRVKELEGKEEFEEEKYHAEQLQRLCFSRPTSSLER